VEHFKQDIGNFVTMKDMSKNTKFLMTIPTLDERRRFDTLNTQENPNSDFRMFSKHEF